MGLMACKRCLSGDCSGFAGYTDPRCKEHGFLPSYEVVPDVQVAVSPEAVDEVLDELTQEAERLGMYETSEVEDLPPPRDPDREPDIPEEWSDAEFLAYVESHSKERLPLFGIAMVRRFMALAGEDDYYNFLPRRSAHVLPMPYDVIKDLLARAREGSRG